MARLHPLQNRVLPTGEIVAIPDRGLFLGNRGGRIHDVQTKTLTKCRWASRRWICCVTSFKNRQRELMGASYTELFFMDEVTALASGHRPCFECRRAEAKAFAAAFTGGMPHDGPLKADAMDLILQADRVENGKQKRYSAAFGTLPDAAMFLWQGKPHAVRDSKALMWTPSGYEVPRTAVPTTSVVSVLTPECIVRALSNGYAPTWHPSATA